MKRLHKPVVRADRIASEYLRVNLEQAQQLRAPTRARALVRLCGRIISHRASVISLKQSGYMRGSGNVQALLVRPYVMTHRYQPCIIRALIGAPAAFVEAAPHGLRMRLEIE